MISSVGPSAGITQDHEETTTRGRPRSAAAHEAIIFATLELLTEHGFEALTIESVAARAGVGKATVYRRWNGKDELVLEALQGAISEIPIPDTGETRADLVQMVEGFAKALASPLGKLLREMSAEFSRHPDLAASFRKGFVVPRRRIVRQVVVRGIERGDLRSDIDPDDVLDLLAGALHYRLLVGGTPVDPSDAEPLVDLVLCGIAAPAADRPPR